MGRLSMHYDTELDMTQGASKLETEHRSGMTGVRLEAGGQVSSGRPAFSLARAESHSDHKVKGF